MRITPEISRIIGHLYGDGCLDKHGKMYYINKNNFLIKKFVKCIKVAFGKNTKTTIYISPNMVKRVYVEKAVPNRLIDSFTELRTRKMVPKLLLNSNMFIIKNFLQAIFDDEGSILWHKKTSCRQIAIGLKNRNVIFEIKQMLQKIGIKTNKIMKTCQRNCCIMWRLTISSQTNLEKFYRVIGFSHPEKFKKLSCCISDIEQSHQKKKVTFSIILDKLNEKSLTVLQTQQFIKKSETQTRRLLSELIRYNEISFSKSFNYDKIGRKHFVYLINKI